VNPAITPHVVRRRHALSRPSPLLATIVATIIAASVPPALPAQATPSAPTLNFSTLGARMLATAAGREGAADSNTVLSPVSAGLALSLASLGARGSTAGALAHVLGTDRLSRAELIQRGSALITASSNRRDVELAIANAVWTDSAAMLTEAFRKSATAWHARHASLRLHSPHALSLINGWADSATHGKIKRILDTPLPDTTRLFIANAVYFKGKWLNSFDRAATKPHDFTTGSGRKIRVPAMQRTGTIAFRRDNGYQMVRLPYKGDRTAMYVILPDSGGVGPLLSRFARQGWPASLTARDNRRVHLVLPRLHVEHTLDLQPVLNGIGAGIAFDCDRADFRDLATDNHGNAMAKLCIGKASQSVYLDVDEEGTEAAAVTGLGMVTTTAVQLPVEFVVDRPFIMVLRDDTTGADLFAGSIVHP
jgi:serine protease inhibitor